MSEEQAWDIIDSLSQEELIILNEMIKALEKKRQPSQFPPASET